MNKTEAISYVKKIRDYAFNRGRKENTWYKYHNHIYGVALLAEEMAKKLQLNSELAFSLGLLHDCGKLYEDEYKRFHGIIGYEYFKNIDLQIARISLNHMFLYNKIFSYQTEKNKFFNQEKDYVFTREFLKNNLVDEYDLLIQFCDWHSNCYGIVTFNERIDEYLTRHSEGLSSYDLNTVPLMKNYFDRKLGMDVYELYENISKDYYIDESYTYSKINDI